MMQAEDYVAIAFGIGVLNQLVKIGDFLLTPSQQGAFQKRVEDVVRYLHAVRPVRVFSWLQGRRGKWVIVLPMVIVGSLLVLIIVRGQIQDNVGREAWSLSVVWDAAVDLLIILIGTVLLVRLAMLTWRFETTAFLKATGVHRMYVALRAVGIALVGFTPFVALFLPQQPGAVSAVATPLLIGTLVAFMVGVVWLAPALAILSAIALWFLALLGYGVIWFFRGLGIRIVQYQKGAWQAVLMLVTAALGVAAAYLKFLSQ